MNHGTSKTVGGSTCDEFCCFCSHLFLIMNYETIFHSDMCDDCLCFRLRRFCTWTMEPFSDYQIVVWWGSLRLAPTTTSPQLSSAYFLPLAVLSVDFTQPSFTSSSQAASSSIIAPMSQSYSPSMCTAVYQQPAASSIFYPL